MLCARARSYFPVNFSSTNRYDFLLEILRLICVTSSTVQFIPRNINFRYKKKTRKKTIICSQRKAPMLQINEHHCDERTHAVRVRARYLQGKRSHFGAIYFRKHQPCRLRFSIQINFTKKYRD